MTVHREDDAYFDVGADDVDLLDDDDDRLLVAGYDDDDDDDVGYDEVEELLVAGYDDDDDDDDDDDEVGRRRAPRRRRPRGGGMRFNMRKGRGGGGRRRGGGMIRLARQPIMRVPRQIARHIGAKRKDRGDKAISVSTRSTGPIPAGQSRMVESFEVNYDFFVTDLLIYSNPDMIVTNARIGEERVMDGEFPAPVFSALQETRPPVFGVLSSGTSAKFEVLNTTTAEQHFYAVLMGRRKS